MLFGETANPLNTALEKTTSQPMHTFGWLFA